MDYLGFEWTKLDVTSRSVEGVLSLVDVLTVFIMIG